MKITVLGNNGPFPAAGGACSGYLVQEGDTKLLLDCGNGVLSNLQKLVRFEELNVIILSHLHSDHMSDMMVLRYAIQLKRKNGTIKDVLNVFAPDEPEEEYKRLDVKEAFNLNAIVDGTVLKFGNLKITFSCMTHPFKNFAISIENGGKRFVYSGDTAWNENIIEFSRGADLLMLDSGLLSRDKKNDNVPHLTAQECGIVARKAGVKKLLLTHIWPEYNMSDLISEAKAEFECVDATRLMETYEV
jgi:ribonuclease BN (tRNA processing enzyme)